MRSHLVNLLAFKLLVSGGFTRRLISIFIIYWDFFCKSSSKRRSASELNQLATPTTHLHFICFLLNVHHCVKSRWLLFLCCCVALFSSYFYFTSSHRISANALYTLSAKNRKWFIGFAFLSSFSVSTTMLPCKKNHNSISSIPSICSVLSMSWYNNNEKMVDLL